MPRIPGERGAPVAMQQMDLIIMEGEETRFPEQTGFLGFTDKLYRRLDQATVSNLWTRRRLLMSRASRISMSGRVGMCQSRAQRMMARFSEPALMRSGMRFRRRSFT